jgi:formylglycine-generating enzyme
VVCVSGNDAAAFCQWLSKREGKHYRLPTEAEWEYACRAGTQTVYPWGDNPDDGKGWANCADQTYMDKMRNTREDGLGDDIFKWRDGFAYTSPVGSFRPNAWGLYDMIGDVEQWCSDDYDNYPPGDLVDPYYPDPPDPDDTALVSRGGGWDCPPDSATCSSRSRHFLPAIPDVGFRCVVDIP